MPRLVQHLVDRFVQGEYSGYSAIVDNLVTEPPDILAGTVTNLPGRIQIDGATGSLLGDFEERAVDMKGLGQMTTFVV